MRVIALTYNYNLNKLSNIGRTWSHNVYKNKEFIFQYSAASYATFINKNPNLILNVYTDDIELLSDKLSIYNINMDNIVLIDYNYELRQYDKKDYYSFEIANDFIDFAKSKTDYTLKLDNDLIFHDKIIIPAYDEIMLWKYERLVKDGNPLWGEIKMCEDSVGLIDFKIYNIGVLGFPHTFQRNEVKEVMYKMISVDISKSTNVNSKIYHCAEQTANNYIIHKYNYKTSEHYKYITHHFDDKSKCINDAKYLLK